MLSKKEIQQLSVLLKKIDNPHEGLPQPIFDALLRIVPFVACELVITDKKGILLTYRHDKWFKGWHLPGGLMRYNESFQERIDHVIKNELGVKVINIKFLFPYNYNFCVRGHGVSLFFLCQTDKKPKNGKYFKKMPKNIIPAHKKVWEQVSNLIYGKKI